MAGRGVLTLGIETSCDETAAAVVADGRRTLSNVIASQAEIHGRYGGVFPEMASRRHLEAILPVLYHAVTDAGVAWSDLSLIAVTNGPGLVGSLLVGLSAAKALSFALDLPLVGVHHILGHIYANFLNGDGSGGEGEGGRGTVAQAFRSLLPAVSLVVSGGHTHLFYIDEDHVALLGRTRDDAAGEAFDKVARLLGLPYPGGPAIDRLAREGEPDAVGFPRAMLDRPGYDFSFSGLKTAVAVHIERERAAGREPCLADIAASFQKAVVDVLVSRTMAAATDYGVRHILLAGGVAANSALRRAFAEAAERAGVSVCAPPASLCTDNAAMIACAGYHLWLSGQRSGLDLDVDARLPFPAAIPFRNASAGDIPAPEAVD